MLSLARPAADVCAVPHPARTSRGSLCHGAHSCSLHRPLQLPCGSRCLPLSAVALCGRPLLLAFAVGLQVHLVPGSVEQRGTDLSAALAGRRPFCRALTWGGASLLLTAQLGEAFLEGAAAGRHLKLGLKAAGEGGVANAQAGRVLPGGQLHLGVVALPDVQVSLLCWWCCCA